MHVEYSAQHPVNTGALKRWKLSWWCFCDPSSLHHSFQRFNSLILWYDSFWGVSLFLSLHSWQKARFMSNMSASISVQVSTGRVRQRISEHRVMRQQRAQRFREGMFGESREASWPGPRWVGLFSRSWGMEAPSFPYFIWNSTHVSINGMPRDWMKEKYSDRYHLRGNCIQSFNPIFPVLMLCSKMPESYHSNEFTK